MAMNYLISLPFSHFFSSFIMDFRNSFAGGTSAVLERPIFGCKIPYVQVNATTNQRFVDVCGRAKRVMYNVRVSDAGSGKFTIDGNHYSEFRSLLARFCFLIKLNFWYSKMNYISLVFQRNFVGSIYYY